MMNNHTPHVLEVSDVTVAYGSRVAVSGASFAVARGTMTALIGPNGAGKSTLLRAIMNLIPRTAGTVRVHNRPLHQLRKQIAYVPQGGEVDWQFPITVGQTVRLGIYPRRGLLSWPTRAMRARVHQALARVGLTELEHRAVDELSGGQQQRMFLARALTQSADLYLLDEPFAGVDAASEKVIIAVLNELKQAGAAILIVHHDLNTLANYFDNVIVLNREIRAIDRPSEVLQSVALREAYGLAGLAEE